jgi:hypothetical protein
MDADQRRTEMNDLLGRIADEQVRLDLAKRFDAALAAWEQAATPEGKAAQEKTLDAVKAEAQAASGAGGGSRAPGRSGGNMPGGTQDGFLSKAGFLLVVAVIVAAGAFVWVYFDEPGAKNFTSDGTVRPLLVLTLIIAMLGFGGLLIVRALFMPDSFDKVSERFRLAREIFLIFAGTFSTIVGFYFGSETDHDDDSSAPTVMVGYGDGRVSATVSGGHEPFLGIFTRDGDDAGRTMTVDERLLSIASAGCPAGASIVVVDGRGQRSETGVDCEPEETGNDTDAATSPGANDNGAGNNITG